MAAWKQLVFAILILAAAAVAWVLFFPGAQQVLARIGIGDATSTGAQQAETQREGGRSSPMVIAAQVRRATINDRLQAIGTGQANASVTVNPFDSGRLVEVPVTAGTRVEAGTVLVRLDSDIQEVALARSKIAVADAQSKLERVKALRASRTSTDVQVADAQLVLSNAELAERDAQLALDRRAVLSPIAGIVGILPVELGDYVTSQTAIGTIDDRSRIIVDFWVPERFAGMIKIGGSLTASPVAQPGAVFDGTVSAVDNRLDEKSRTLHVQASLPNEDDTLRAGMSFQVTMKFPGDSFPAVDPLAIQWGGDGAFIWLVRDGKAVRTPVRIVQRNTESVLVDAPITEGEMVVTQGIHAVREGGEVRIADREQTIAPVAAGG